MITPPNYQRDAIPTRRGWTHPRTVELLVSKKLTQEQIDEYLGLENVEPEIIVDATLFPELDPEVNWQAEEEEPLEFMNMTKLELEELGREHGIELDRREKKTTLIERLKQVIS